MIRLLVKNSVLLLCALLVLDIAMAYDRITLDDGKLLEVSVEPLNPDEGYLVLELNPNFAIRRVVLAKVGSTRKAFQVKNVREKSIHIVRLKEGEYYFSELKLKGGSRFELSEALNFKVEAGVVNYPGELLIDGGKNAFFAKIILKNRLFKFTDYYGQYLRKYYSDYKIVYNGSYADVTAEEVGLCCD